MYILSLYTCQVMRDNFSLFSMIFDHSFHNKFIIYVNAQHLVNINLLVKIKITVLVHLK